MAQNIVYESVFLVVAYQNLGIVAGGHSAGALVELPSQAKQRRAETFLLWASPCRRIECAILVIGSCP
jgi:hypothetical protein